MVRVSKGLPGVATVIVILVAVALLFVLRARGGDKPARVVGHGQIRFQGLGPERWAMRWRQEHKAVLWLKHEVNTLRARLVSRRRLQLHSPDSLEAIRLASVAYGVNAGLLVRRADCETGGSYSRYAQNRTSGASGLFQFLPSTWQTTPYARESIWSPYANALAAAWMERSGRGGEWVCR